LLVGVDGQHAQTAAGGLGGDLKGQGRLAHSALVGDDGDDSHHRTLQRKRNTTTREAAAPDGDPKPTVRGRGEST
jgi:hypothetical protein